MGLVIAVVVTRAGGRDAAGAELVWDRVRGNRRLAVVAADAAYHRHTLERYLVATDARSRLAIVGREKGVVGFAVPPKRWIVARTCSWLRARRLLAWEYEGSCQMSYTAVSMRSMMLTLKKYQQAKPKNPQLAEGQHKVTRNEPKLWQQYT